MPSPQGAPRARPRVNPEVHEKDMVFHTKNAGVLPGPSRAQMPTEALALPTRLGLDSNPGQLLLEWQIF